MAAPTCISKASRYIHLDAFWDEKLAAFKVEAEPVDLMIGSSSSDIKLTTTVRVQ